MTAIKTQNCIIICFVMTANAFYLVMFSDRFDGVAALLLCDSCFVLWVIVLINLIFLPVTESLTESLRGDLKFRLEPLFSYWHWYNPSLLKVTWRMLKVAELLLDLFLNESEFFFRMNVPPKTWVEIEQVMPTFWPQLTSPAGFMEILGFGKVTEKATQYVREY